MHSDRCEDKTEIPLLLYGKTFTDGLIFMLMVIYLLRSKGTTREILLQTNNGSEFGGVPVDKLEYPNKAIFSVLNAKLAHMPSCGASCVLKYSNFSYLLDMYLYPVEFCRDRLPQTLVHA